MFSSTVFTFQIRHEVFSPLHLRTVLNIYMISSRCHVFILIFRASYTSNNETECVQETVRGRAAQREEAEKPFELTVYPSHGKHGGYFRTQKYFFARLFYLKRTSYCQILILFKGNYQHGGKAVHTVYVCPHLQLHVDENICALVTASLTPEGNAVRWWAISFPLCIVWLLLFDIQCGDINKDVRT